MGRNTVREVLRLAPERFQKILISGTEENRDKTIEALLSEARSKKIIIEKCELAYLNSITGSDSHQGLVAVVKERHIPGLKETLQKISEKEESLILVLDSIQDPQNLGALLRAAECFAVDAVIISSNRGAEITASVTKASVGASEILNIITVSNLVDSIRKLKEFNYWIIAADADKDAQSLKGYEFPKRAALVMGSEGKGLQALLKKEADFSVFIPLFGRIESLNVSQAAAVMLSQYRLSNPTY